jgi:hypothetical protein
MTCTQKRYSVVLGAVHVGETAWTNCELRGTARQIAAWFCAGQIIWWRFTTQMAISTACTLRVNPSPTTLVPPRTGMTRDEDFTLYSRRHIDGIDTETSDRFRRVKTGQNQQRSKASNAVLVTRSHAGRGAKSFRGLGASHFVTAR